MAPDEPPSDCELRRRAEQLGIRTPRQTRVYKEARNAMLALLRTSDTDDLRERSMAITRELETKLRRMPSA